MAAPSLTVSRSPSGVVSPGTQIVFTVTATDADSRSVSYVFSAVDGQGNPVSVTENVVVSDPVTVSASVSDPAGTATTPVQDGVNPSLWRSNV